ncbi:hypothetical protein EG349_06415 [Chryseobacterium shandongense]|uniref:Uncharacterized protein n=2 Tax=Chryseobacterium shandongense TaxID=1493872 RepID=A0AAD0YCV4_9FLAO|nr:hypothetical protein EG349_06415 [Chryseobacterium shandongense]AZA94852.1 hypothetical protein EG353_04425 [Chryseobacterium shandongense]
MEDWKQDQKILLYIPISKSINIMKKHLILTAGLAFTSFGQNIKSQSILDEYKKFDINGSSSEVMYAIENDFRQSPNKDFVILKSNEQLKYPLKNERQVQDYIASFNTSLEVAKKDIQMNELIWKAENEIRKYGVNVLSNYALALPSKHITNFLVPAIQRGHELYVDREFQLKLEKNDAKVDQMIVDLTNILYTKGIDLTTANDEAAFNNLFELAHKRIPALGKEEYGVFNKELTKRAYDFIKTNRSDINLLKVKVDNYRKTVKEFDLKLTEFQKNITEEVTTELNNVGESIIKLNKNQNEIFETLDGIQQRITDNNVRIKQLEHEMNGLQNNIGLLKSKQDEHSVLIAQNSFQIDILSGYTFQNLNTNQKIDALAKGHFDNVFQPGEKEKLLKELNEIKTKETIISVASGVEQYSSAIYGGLVNSGILKGEDAVKVGKFMSVVSIVSGAARVYAGDVSGLTSIVSGIGGFSGKPKPSAEMQMLQKMMNFMNERFNRIDENLRRIDSKIDALSETTLDMYKTMSLSFQFSFDQMDRIIWKTDILNKKATMLLFQDYEKCRELTDAWDRIDVKLNTYADYQKYFIQETQQCLQSLSNLPNNNFYFTVATNRYLKDEKEIEYEIKEIYNPTKELFTLYYDKDINNATFSLMFPFNMSSDANKPYYLLSNIASQEIPDQTKALDDLYNFDMINEFVDFSMRLSNYFLIKGGNVNFAPLKLIDYLRDSNKSINNDLVQRRFLKLNDITRSAIAQQSLLAGHLLLDPIYNSLFGYSTDLKTNNLAIKVLNNNKLLATNFSTYLINNNIDMSDRQKVETLMKNALSDEKALADLNSLIGINDILFVVDKNKDKLYLSFERNNQKIKLPVADFNSLFDNKMINTDATYSLSQTQQNINSKLIDLKLPKNFDGKHKNIFKYYYMGDQ